MTHEADAPVVVGSAGDVVLIACPSDPDDARHLVGERDGCFVVMAAPFDLEHPALYCGQRLFTFGGLAMR